LDIEHLASLLNSHGANTYDIADAVAHIANECLVMGHPEAGLIKYATWLVDVPGLAAGLRTTEDAVRRVLTALVRHDREQREKKFLNNEAMVRARRHARESQERVKALLNELRGILEARNAGGNGTVPAGYRPVPHSFTEDTPWPAELHAHVHALHGFLLHVINHVGARNVPDSTPVVIAANDLRVLLAGTESLARKIYAAPHGGADHALQRVMAAMRPNGAREHAEQDDTQTNGNTRTQQTTSASTNPAKAAEVPKQPVPPQPRAPNPGAGQSSVGPAHVEPPSSTIRSAADITPVGLDLIAASYLGRRAGPLHTARAPDQGQGNPNPNPTVSAPVLRPKKHTIAHTPGHSPERKKAVLAKVDAPDQEPERPAFGWAPPSVREGQKEVHSKAKQGTATKEPGA
jgi:hypothetical protein